MMMRPSGTAPVLPVAAAFLLTAALSACDGDEGTDLPDDRTVGEIIDAETGSLSTLAGFLEQAGLRASLDGDGPFTVFAPTNTAFDAIETEALSSPENAALLAEVLEYHIVPGAAIRSGEIGTGRTVTTLEGTSLELAPTEGGFTVNGAPVRSADIEGANGVVHIIDGVLLGTLRVEERIRFTRALGDLAAAIHSAGLAGTLNGTGPFTVFAPGNTAFAALDVHELTADPTLLQEVLGYHVLDSGAFTASDLETGSPTRTTAGGQTVQIALDNGTLRVNRASVITADVPVANGVLHVIDGVLLETTRGTERIRLTADYSLMDMALERAGLVSTLASGTYTIFVPTDAAFLALLDADTSGAIEEEEFPSAADLEDILLYHVVPGTVPSSIIHDSDAATTLEGSSLFFGVAASGTITINPTTDAATVTVVDLGAENGVVHEIDTVLIP